MSKTKTSVIIIIAVLITARLAAPTLIKNFINKKINTSPDIRGQVQTVHLHVIRGGIALEDIDLKKLEQKKEYPLLKLKKITAFISWPALFHKEVVANVEITAPQLTIEKVVPPPPPAPMAKNERPKTTAPRVVPPQTDPVAELRQAIPFNVSRIQIHDGTLIYQDFTQKPSAPVTVNKIEVNADNLTNSTKVAETLFATVQAKGEIMHSGRTQIALKVNPLREPPEFKLDFQLVNLDIAKLNPLMTASANVQVKKGFLDVASEVATDHKKLEGYVKPLVHDLKVSDYHRDKKQGLGHAIKEKLIGAAAVIIKNQPHEQQATEIPFHGSLDEPHIDVWVAIKKTIGNVIIQALSPNLDHSVKLADLRRRKNG